MRSRWRRERGFRLIDVVPPPVPCGCPPGTPMIPTADGAGFVHVPPCPFTPPLEDPEPCPMAPYAEAVERNKQEIATAFGVSRAALNPTPGPLGEDPDTAPLRRLLDRARQALHLVATDGIDSTRVRHCAKLAEEIAVYLDSSATPPPVCPGCGFRHPGSHPPAPSGWERERQAAVPFMGPESSGPAETPTERAYRLDREAHDASRAYRQALHAADEAHRAIGGRP